VDDIRCKVRYKKKTIAVGALERDVDLELMYVKYPSNGRINFRMSAHWELNGSYGHVPPFRWSCHISLLREFAVALAKVNGRKNVCDVEAESGLLY